MNTDKCPREAAARILTGGAAVDMVINKESQVVLIGREDIHAADRGESEKHGNERRTKHTPF